MRDRERGDDDDQRPQPAERDHEADQEQQMVGAFEDVPEARHDEAQRRLMPARIETHQARIAVELERARRRRRAAGSAAPSTRCGRSGRTRGWIANSERSDRIGYSSSTSSSCWFQVELEVVGERAARPHARAPSRTRRTSGRTAARCAHRRCAAPAARVVLGDGDVVDQIELGGAAQRLVGARRCRDSRGRASGIPPRSSRRAARGSAVRADCRRA